MDTDETIELTELDLEPATTPTTAPRHADAHEIEADETYVCRGVD